MEQALTTRIGVTATRSPLQRAIDESDLTWRVLGTLNLFRLFLAVILLGLFFAGGEPRLFGDRYPSIFSAMAAGYLVFHRYRPCDQDRWVSAGLQTIYPGDCRYCGHRDSDACQWRHQQRTGRTPARRICWCGQPGIANAGAGLFCGRRDARRSRRAVFSQLGGVSDTSNYSAAGILGAIIFRNRASRPDHWQGACNQRGAGATARCRSRQPVRTESNTSCSICAKASSSSTATIACD